MPSLRRFAFASCLLGLAACADASSDAPSAASGAPRGPAASIRDDDAARAVAEADIVQVAGGRLYALSRAGTLSIVDVSRPGSLSLLGQIHLPGEPFEMYLRGEVVVVMTNGAFGADGGAHEPAIDPTTGRRIAQPAVAPLDRTTGAALIAVDAAVPARMARLGTFAVAGEIADSRIVGDVLYLVTYENASCYRCGDVRRTIVTSFDVAEPANVREVSTLAFADGASDEGWGEAWKRAVYTTGAKLYVGGHTDELPSSSRGLGEGVIDVVDVSDPGGRLRDVGRITTAGAVLSRWQMDEKDGVLRVVSQRGIGYTPNGIGEPYIETFTASGAFPVTATVPIRLPRQESLKTVRFDGDRAYAITFAETDPLFVFDLSGPIPEQRGELEMPGWVFHIEPFGDRLLGLGLDRRSSEGHLNVSLFDVADMDHPRMLERVSFGDVGITSDDEILDEVLPEDQSRIQKAFRVLDDGLVVVPYSHALYASGAWAYGGRTHCATTGGVQLLRWEGDTLTRKATLEVSGAPRRALLNGRELLAVSDSHVSSWDLSSLDVALRTADVDLAGCGAEDAPGRATSWRQPRRSYGDDVRDEPGLHCAVGAVGGAPVSPAGFTLVGFALGVGLLRRRPREDQK